jgi:tetratricopeptide (TPR) repeat protein
VAQAELGQLQQGLHTAEQALQMARAAGFREGEIDCLRVVGTLYARVGNYQDAEGHLIGSADLSAKQNARYQQGLALYELGRLYQQRSLVDRPVNRACQPKARSALNKAATVFEGLGAARDHRRVLTALGQLQTNGQRSDLGEP